MDGNIDLSKLLQGNNILLVILVGVVVYLFRQWQSGKQPDGKKPEDDPLAGHPILNLIWEMLTRKMVPEKPVDVVSQKLDGVKDDIAMAALAAVLSKDADKAKKFKELL